ncbi:MAG TPA: GMC family oxidoreductase N-terminal domain-containing protein [Anaerolineae bacterium]|nr:GMC family oxidoreductase N-terminal domain-containing protein [Anaerolineae bacterium]
MPSIQHLTPRQFATLSAICDTLVPAIERADDPHGFWKRTASDLNLPQLIVESVFTLQDEVAQAQFKQLLNLLDRPLTSAALTGHFKRFVDLSVPEREEVLRRWSLSPLGLLRQSFQGLKRLTHILFYAVSDAEGLNPNWPVLGYPAAPHLQRRASPTTVRSTFVDTDLTLECDAVIVGSGAGGGVVAGELAQAGKSVIVLEKGGHFTENTFPDKELAAYRLLYENQGVLATRDLGVVVLAGSTLGGGTTVNWTASFRTPVYVLEEWSREHGLKNFLAGSYQASLDAVSRRTHVDVEESRPNPQNQKLLDGCRALNYQAAPVPRNVDGCGDTHQCGFCTFGCSLGSKQSTLNTYLPDAVDHGARIFTSVTVDRILIENGAAIGVSGTAIDPAGRSRSLTVRSKIVVVAAGSIHSPALLLRSNIDNRNIGLNLHLHPTSATYGLYADPIETWYGIPMAIYSDQFENLDGRHYGFTIETPPAHMGLWGLGLQWRGGEQHKQVMSQVNRCAAFIVLTRDRDGGRVTIDKYGRPILHYRLSQHDGQHLMRGLVETVRVHAAAGAEEIGGPIAALPVYRKRDGALNAYLDRLQRQPLRTNGFALFSAHQMSSCRMGVNRATSVIDERCESHDVRGLFVTDGSSLPTAAGVNPMLTIMATAHQAAQYIKTRC